MPRFHFHYRNGIDHINDGEGLLLPDEAAARREAMRVIREQVAFEVRDAGIVCVATAIEIADGDSNPVDRVTFDDAIRIE